MTERGGAATELGARERGLLLGCARLDGEEAHVGRAAELIREGLDWEAVSLHALLHSVGPLLHMRLSELTEYELVPAAARQRLLGLSHRAAYQNGHLAREHRELVEALRAAGVEVLVPKGISLVELVYGGHERRPLIDLVYLVRPGDLDRAAGVLAKRGYETRPEHPLTAAWRWACPAATMTANRGVSTMVVLLTGAISRPRLHSPEPEGVWSRAEPVRVAGAEALMPSPEDLVIYLCTQADAHGYLNGVAVGAVDPGELLFSEWANNRLVRFVDIRETIRHHAERIDWEALVHRAAASGLGEAVGANLELTEALLGRGAAPEGIVDRLRSGERPRLRGALLDQVRAQAYGDRAGAGTRRVGSWWIGLGPRRQIAVPLLSLAEVAFCSLGALERRHPRWPGPALALAYPLRAAWIVARAALALARRLASGAARRLRLRLARLRPRRPRAARA